MSSMKLRESIRAPLRYGEDDFDEPRRTSLRHGNDDFFDDPMELGESGGPRPQKRRKLNPVPFNPNLPPAAFPSLDRLQPGRDPTSRQNGDGGDWDENRHTNGILLPQPNERSAPTLPLPGMEEVPVSCLENHIASNNMDNPVYARNVSLASMPPIGTETFEDMTTSSDSDDDPLPDATQVLLDGIPNPQWNDLHPAMQVEIVENVMKYHSWRRVCDLFGLGSDERTEFMNTLGIRNKQIERENKRLEQMRFKQRNALMRIDNSDLKLFDPPPQLVLKRIAKETTRGLLTKYTDLLMCQAHDVLKARQYLHQHGLPRRYAGEWGDSLVVLRESEESPHEPDKFEWTENLRITPPPDEVKNPMFSPENPVSSSKTAFIQSFVMSGTMNPRDLRRRNSDPEPAVDWSRYFKRNPDSSWNTQEPRIGGFVRLNVGSQRAAQIQQYKKTGLKPEGWPAFRKPPVVNLRSSPPPELPSTPSKPPRNGFTQSMLQQPARPISRVLTGDWQPRDISPSVSQAKYRQRIQKAKLERLETQAEAIRRQFCFQPALRVDGVGAGIKFTSQHFQPRPSSDQPRSVSQQIEENPSSSFFARANRGMTMRSVDQIMDEFICFEPIVPPQNEPQQTEDDVAEPPDEQQSSSDVSSLTDLSMDDVMLVPTDGCSSSQ